MGIKKRHGPGCTCCGAACIECCCNGYPTGVTITITGLTADTGDWCYEEGGPFWPGGFHCSFDCTDLNGTYSLSYVSGCIWQGSGTFDAICDGAPITIPFTITLTVTGTGGSPINISILAQDLGGSGCPLLGFVAWQGVVTVAQDCDVWNFNLDMELEYDTGICLADGGSMSVEV